MALDFHVINGLQPITDSKSPKGIVEYTFKSASNKYSLYARHWPVESPKAIAIIIHGAGEHCARYDEMAELLRKESIYSFANDHVGHGRSGGEKQFLENFEYYTNDCYTHLMFMKEKFPNVKVFCIGHSMGGLIAADLANKMSELSAALNGVVLIAPCMGVSADSVSPLVIMVMKIMSFILPRMQIQGIDPKLVSRDQKEVEIYDTDPLVWHGGLKARFCKELYDALTRISKTFSSIEWPYLLMHSDKDKLCDFNASENFHNATRSSDKVFKKYYDLYHAIHKELPESRKIVFEDLMQWVKQRID